eukprot:scaffold95189_cov15-Tisochrysis_lutea.AAC.1
MISTGRQKAEKPLAHLQLLWSHISHTVHFLRIGCKSDRGPESMPDAGKQQHFKIRLQWNLGQSG